MLSMIMAFNTNFKMSNCVDESFSDNHFNPMKTINSKPQIFFSKICTPAPFETQ